MRVTALWMSLMMCATALLADELSVDFDQHTEDIKKSFAAYPPKQKAAIEPGACGAGDRARHYAEGCGRRCIGDYSGHATEYGLCRRLRWQTSSVRFRVRNLFPFTFT